MAQAEPQLLSLLEKTANPLQNVSLQISVKGVYAPPEQWKLTDQANPNVFTYTAEILGQQFGKGKIDPRKLTQKELREQEQKGKKGGKKQTKEQENPPEQDPEEEQRKKRQWDALSEDEKFYRTSQDPYKSFSLKFGQEQKDLQLQKQGIIDLETNIDNQAIEIVLTRKPDMNEEEVQKLKKSKPKTLNIGELYAAVYKGKVNLKQLAKPGATTFTQRIKVQFACELPDQCIKIEPDGCYILLQITSSTPLTPEVKEIKPRTEQILPQFKNKQPKTNILAELKLQINRSIRALSQQYISHFSKGQQDQRRNTTLGSVSTLRLNEINKKKEIFLNDFMNSGKFKILRQRLGKVIKAAVIDKFRKEKSNRPISSQQISKTISQINLYFQQKLTKSIDEFMAGESTSIHEDLVVGYESSRQVRKQAISPIAGESQEDREGRLAGEYEILQMQAKAEENYINIILLSNGSSAAKQNYARFCLRNKKFDEAYLLFTQIASSSPSLKLNLIRAVLLVNRRRVTQAKELLFSMISNPQSTLADKIICNLLLSFMYERGGDIKQSQDYLAIAERYYKMKQNPHLKFNPPINPYELPKPKLPKPEKYSSQLSHSQSQQIRLNFVNLLAELHLYNMVGECLPKLDDSFKKSVLEIEVQIFRDNFEGALQKINALLKKSDNIRNIDLLMTKADICFRSQKMFECEQIFLDILQLKPDAENALKIYLKLGFTYLNRKSWEDAKMVFEKACEQKFNCSVSWLGLGIAKLKMNMYKQAEQCLNLSKIYNPLSQQTAAYQKQINQYYHESSSKQYKYSSESVDPDM